MTAPVTPEYHHDESLALKSSPHLLGQYPHEVSQLILYE
jgi:hypothetical protein